MNNSQIKYPYIGEGKSSGSVVVFYNQGRGVTLHSKTWASENMECHYGIDESYFTNITREYLANTYGEVVSPEHAEFIVELCNANNIPLTDRLNINSSNHFVISHTGLAFYNCTRVSSTHLKQITIPLPPKAPETLSPDEETELKSRAMASELNSQSNDEWPKVGDEVICKFCKFKVVAKYNKMLMLATLDDCGFALAGIKDCEKPKTKEDLLIEDLQTKLVKNNAVDSWMLAANIISGDIDGLTYTSKDGE